MFKESLEDLQDLVGRDCRSSTLATNSLNHSCLVDLIDMTLADDDGYSMLFNNGLTGPMLVSSIALMAEVRGLEPEVWLRYGC